MGSSIRLATESRDAHLALRRVERQQHLIERLHGAPAPVPLAALARELRVSARTVARDVRRLRESGVPVTAVAGRSGGVRIDRHGPVAPVALDLPEIAAALACLAAVGPTTSESATSAMRKLGRALG